MAYHYNLEPVGAAAKVYLRRMLDCSLNGYVTEQRFVMCPQLAM